MEQHQSPKVYVSVLAEFNTEGILTPISFVWENGKRYIIDKVLDVRRAASLKAGGMGMRYTCRVCGRQTYLYQEEDRWFMERKS